MEIYDTAELEPVTSKEALELDRAEVRSLSHIKRTAPGFAWK